MKIPLFLSVVLIVTLPLATGQSSCPLPTIDDIESRLIGLLVATDALGSGSTDPLGSGSINALGSGSGESEGQYDPTVSSHQYTCLAQGSTRDTYRRVSIIATFTPKSGQPSQTQHFQLECSSGTWSAITDDGFNTPPSNPMMRTDCFNCVLEYLGADSNHCLCKLIKLNRL